MIKKIYHPLTLRCTSAVVLGIMAAAILVMSLIAYSEFSAARNVQTSIPTVTFPENEEHLTEMVNAMLTAEGVAAIEPAAGDPLPAPTQDKN